MQYIEWFLSAGGMVAGTMFLTTFLISKIGDVSDVVKWLISLVSGEAFAFFGWQVVARFLHLGIFVDTETMTWTVQSVAAVGVGVVLVANRIFTLQEVKEWLRRLFGIIVNRV